MVRMAILASGSGSNAEEIIQYFQEDPSIEVSAILTNRPRAGILDRAKNHGIETRVFQKSAWKNSEKILEFFSAKKIDFIVLAGYLQKIPEYLIRAYPNKIVNIHPALLPAYGGHGMYGMNVHEAVHENREPFSGITIHLVNEQYDKGEIIFQAKCSLNPVDNPDEIRRKVLQLEHRYFSPVIKYLASE